MKIAFIGTRGVPANYGGFETCAEEVGKRLVARGHEITVYCRKSYYSQEVASYYGMKLSYLPNINYKVLDTLSHTLLSIVHALFLPYDVLMVFNAANSPVMIFPRLLGRRIVINPDGLEWQRGKWGVVARRYYKISEWLSAKIADRIISDSLGIQKYYHDEYGTSSSYIAYGAYLTHSKEQKLLSRFGVLPGEYFLQITRFEPENNPLLTIQAYKRLRTNKKLVLVGGIRYQSLYSRQIAEEAGGKNIVLPGFLYDKDALNELWCNCYSYIHGNEVGGTNPALLQSMASGCFTIARDVPFNREVLGDGGIYFEKTAGSLETAMDWALHNQAALETYKCIAKKRIVEQFSWDKVTEQYESLFRELIRSKKIWFSR